MIVLQLPPFTNYALVSCLRQHFCCVRADGAGIVPVGVVSIAFNGAKRGCRRKFGRGNVEVSDTRHRRLVVRCKTRVYVMWRLNYDVLKAIKIRLFLRYSRTGISVILL